MTDWSLVWTDHVELKDQFRTAIFDQKDLPRPIFTLCISKESCRVKGEFDISRIYSMINKAIDFDNPLSATLLWEEECFAAASQVTNELSNLASVNAMNLVDWRNLWKEKYNQLISKLAIAESGKQLKSDSCISSFYKTLNPLHSDKLEHFNRSFTNSLKKYSLTLYKTTPIADEDAKAKINTTDASSF